ncbi:MAG: hypothetical protein DMG71_05595 [Acidobacteria bacterium]|nr:MAG: hypothetical protein DMG71_05595 [Acidobacteriota bacterium]
MKRIVSRTNLFTAVAGIILALSGAAYADGTTAAATSQKPLKAKGGTLKISEATDVAGVILEPGKYEVKQVNSKAGLAIRFTLFTYDHFAEEAQSPYEWDVVAEVKVTVQPLTSKATHTDLKVASDGRKAIALQIRGNSFEYLF